MYSPESAFQEDLRALINRYSKENESNTPDFVLAEFLLQVLEAFNRATNTRTTWFRPEGCEKPTTELTLIPVNATGFSVTELTQMHPDVKLPDTWEAEVKRQEFPIT